MALGLFSNLKKKDKDKAIEDLIHDATPRADFFLLVALSVLMATFGLLINNPAVIIGSMLIAPILSPILSLSLGVVMSNFEQVQRSITTVGKSLFFSIILAATATFLFNPDITTTHMYNDEILSRVEPSLVFLAIAVVAGLAASFARIKPDLSETLPGIAISVALIPPIAVIGIGLASLDWAVASGAFMLFLLNAFGIVFASMLIFSLMNLYAQRDVAKKVLEREENLLKQERNQVHTID